MVSLNRPLIALIISRKGQSFPDNIPTILGGVAIPSVIASSCYTSYMLLGTNEDVFQGHLRYLGRTASLSSSFTFLTDFGRVEIWVRRIIDVETGQREL